MMKKQPCSEINAFKNSDPASYSIKHKNGGVESLFLPLKVTQYRKALAKCKDLLPGHHTPLHVGRPPEMTVEAAMEVILATMGTTPAADS